MKCSQCGKPLQIFRFKKMDTTIEEVLFCPTCKRSEKND